MGVEPGGAGWGVGGRFMERILKEATEVSSGSDENQAHQRGKRRRKMTMHRARGND